MWTIERVRAELPDVPFRQRISKNGYNVGTGQLAGREDFATLYIRANGGVQAIPFAWSTIVNALNNHRYLII